MELAHGYMVIAKFNDGTDDMVFEYESEKLADSVVRSYEGCSFVESVVKVEF